MLAILAVLSFTFVSCNNSKETKEENKENPELSLKFWGIDLGDSREHAIKMLHQKRIVCEYSCDYIDFKAVNENVTYEVTVGAKPIDHIYINSEGFNSEEEARKIYKAILDTLTTQDVGLQEAIKSLTDENGVPYDSTLVDEAAYNDCVKRLHIALNYSEGEEVWYISIEYYLMDDDKLKKKMESSGKSKNKK